MGTPSHPPSSTRSLAQSYQFNLAPVVFHAYRATASRHNRRIAQIFDPWFGLVCYGSLKFHLDKHQSEPILASAGNHETIDTNQVDRCACKNNQRRQTPQHELDEQRLAEPDDGRRRLPLTRADCEKLERPCPYVSCRHHLFLDVDDELGSIKLNFPGLFDDDGSPRLDEMGATCLLDVADRDGLTLEAVGALLNVTNERIRQMEAHALQTVRKRLAAIGIDGHDLLVTTGVFENPFTDGNAD